MINPFIKNAVLQVIEVTPKNNNIELSYNDSLKARFNPDGKPYLWDKQEKTFIYHSPETFKLLYTKGNLSSMGRDMLLYIVYNLKTDAETIILKPVNICKSLNISRKSFYNGINSLLAQSFIIKKQGAKSDFEYWIDPFLIFNGDRVKYFKQLDPKDESYIKVVARI